MPRCDRHLLLIPSIWSDQPLKMFWAMDADQPLLAIHQGDEHIYGGVIGYWIRPARPWPCCPLKSTPPARLSFQAWQSRLVLEDCFCFDTANRVIEESANGRL